LSYRVRGPKIFEGARVPLPWEGAWLTPRNTPLPHVIVRNLVHTYGDRPEKKWSLAFRLSRSLKAIGTDTDPSATMIYSDP